MMEGEERQKANPDTFEVPSASEKAGIGVGSFVKVGVILSPPVGGHEAERIWVKVTARDGEKLRGEFANDPVLIAAVFGDPVEFSPKNVLSILPQELGKLEEGKSA